MKLPLIPAVIAILFFSSTATAEIKFGDSQAPVTIIKYASYTCGYCVRFHREVLPLIKSFYIETGKVHYIYRDYPTDSAAMYGAVAVQCAGSKYNLQLHDALYNTVEDWYKTKNIDLVITDLAVSLGVNREAFNSCINDSQQILNVKNKKEDAIFNYDVVVTPTFFINGKVVRGMQEFNEMEALIEDAIK